MRCRKCACASRICLLTSCPNSTRARCTSPRIRSCQPFVEERRSETSWSRRWRSLFASDSPEVSARSWEASLTCCSPSALDSARSVFASPSITERPTSSSCNAVCNSATPDFSRSMAAACSLGALAASSNIRADTGWIGASANLGACWASNSRSASRICRQPRNWSVFDRANTTVSTRSAIVARKFSSGAVNGAEASTTNSSAVAPAAASMASSPWAESSPPTPGVSTTLMRSSNGTGPLTST